MHFVIELLAAHSHDLLAHLTKHTQIDLPSKVSYLAREIVSRCGSLIIFGTILTPVTMILLSNLFPTGRASQVEHLSLLSLVNVNPSQRAVQSVVSCLHSTDDVRVLLHQLLHLPDRHVGILSLRGWVQVPTQGSHVVLQITNVATLRDPLLELGGTWVIRLDDCVADGGARVEGLTSVLTNAALSESYDLTYFKISLVASLTPESHANHDVALVTDSDGSSVLLSAISEGDLADWLHVEHNSDHIDCALLYHGVNLVQAREGKARANDALVLLALRDDSVMVKGQAVVILDGCVLLVGQLHVAIAESVDTVLLKLSVKLGGLLVEEGGLDHRALPVDEINVEQLTLSSGVLPCSQVSLLGDSRLDVPVLAELVQARDRCVVVLFLGEVFGSLDCLEGGLIFAWLGGASFLVKLNIFKRSSEILRYAGLGTLVDWDFEVVVLGKLTRLFVGVVVLGGTDDLVHVQC